MATQPDDLATYFYTWNTQGDFTSKPKAKQINAFLDEAGGGKTPVVVFVQEGGVAKAGDYEKWSAVGGAAVGAKNERCTNYILVNSAWQKLVNAEYQRMPLPTQTATSVSPTVLVGGGEAGRTPAALALGRLLLVSWHSLAGYSNEDSAAMFGAFQFNPYYIDRFDRIIVGGDFNTSAKSVTQNPQPEVRQGEALLGLGRQFGPGHPSEQPAGARFLRDPRPHPGVRHAGGDGPDRAQRPQCGEDEVLTAFASPPAEWMSASP